jgi:hypothetical protein
MPCSCNNSINNIPEIQCRSCTEGSVSDPKIVQKQIWNQVRVPSSLYTMNLAALNIANNQDNKPNWNQASDRKVPSLQVAYHPSRGNSTKATLTSAKPGSQAPGGYGVDIKHNSYARYLGKKKATNIRTQNKNIVAVPIEGNKKQNFGIIANSENCFKCPP